MTEAIDLTLKSAGGDREQAKALPISRLRLKRTMRDVYHDGRIDLGAIVGEHLALGLDPYPRSPGVAFAGHIEDEPDADPIALRGACAR